MKVIALGLIGLFQAIPRVLFSLVGGVFADDFATHNS